MKWAKHAGGEGTLAVDRAAKPINDPTHERLADIDSRRASGGSDIAAGMNFLHLTERHQKNPVIAKSHHLGLQARQPRRTDLADVSEGNIRPD